MADQDRDLRARGPVRIGVGYQWDGDHALSDARWKVLRTFLETTARAARNSAIRAAGRSVVAEDDEQTVVDDVAAVAAEEERVEEREREHGVRQVTVARLRATVGDFIWSSVTRHIDDCDVLVFDITPKKAVEGNSKPMVAPNVWLEFGYAHGRGKPVYAIHQAWDKDHPPPSNLHGLMIGTIPEDGKMFDNSLRMALVNTLRRLLLESLEE